MPTDLVSDDQRAMMRPTVGDTLSSVLADPTINAMFGGRDGKLSAGQSGLAAAVTVKMQDRLLDYSTNAHQRELRLIGGLWKLYRTPVLAYVPRLGSATDGTNSVKPGIRKGGLLDLFTWGNLLGGAALLITATALWYTSVSSNYKTLWETAEAEKKSLGEKLQSAQKAAEDQAADWGKAVARADLFEEANKQLTVSQKDMGAELRRLIESNGKAKGELARQTAITASEKTYERLYYKANQELEKLRRERAEAPRPAASSST